MESQETRELGQALERAYRRGWDDAIGPDGDVLTTDQRETLTDVSKTLEYLLDHFEHNLPWESSKELPEELGRAAESLQRILTGEIQ